jgi:hypothetical protein
MKNKIELDSHNSKVVNIIQNCITLEQLESTKKYIKLLKALGKYKVKDYEQMCIYLDELIEVKERQLKYL